MDKRKTLQKRLLIAAGGTGGHVFPAQELAKKLIQEETDIDILFAASGLSSSRFFAKQEFKYKDIPSVSPFGRGLRHLVVSLCILIKGLVKSIYILHKFKPELIVGFGSFHVVPVLLAALLQRIPIILFESNCYPGKVNRFFSRFAKVSLILFEPAKEYLHGQVERVEMLSSEQKSIGVVEARMYFGLQPDRNTLLVFGGSQGAQAINQIVKDALVLQETDLQIIHLAGSEELAEILRRNYIKHRISACVKSFEGNMELAWVAADLAICRAGALTLAEIIAYEVPAILIPFPRSSEQHQLKNARFFEEKIGGGICCEEGSIDSTALLNLIKSLNLEKLKHSIGDFKQKKSGLSLESVVKRELL